MLLLHLAPPSCAITQQVSTLRRQSPRGAVCGIRGRLHLKGGQVCCEDVLLSRLVPAEALHLRIQS